MLKSFFENVRKPKNNIFGMIMTKGMNRGHEKLASWGRGFLEINDHQTVLDLGCGGGRNIQYFLSKVNNVYGMDYSPMSIRIATKLNHKDIKAGRCKIIEGDVSTLPFEDSSIDIVTAFETIYFWPDLIGTFKEIYRILRDGGQFLICNEACNRNDPKIARWAEMLDFPVYAGEDLKNMLEGLGFTRVSYEINNIGNIALISVKS